MKTPYLLALLLLSSATAVAQDTVEGDPLDYAAPAATVTIKQQIPPIERLSALLPSRDLSKAARLDSELQEVLIQHLQHGRSDVRNMVLEYGPYTEIAMTRGANPIVDVTVVGDLEATRRYYERLPGVTVLGVAECAFYGQISLAVPPDQLLALTDAADARAFIASAGQSGKITEHDNYQPPVSDYPAKRAQGAATNQAEDTMGITRAKQLFAVNDGDLYDIGTLSDSAGRIDGIPGGLTGIDESQATGDLPPDAQIVIVDDTAGGTLTDEGRGMMEVIYDVAESWDDFGFGTAFGGEATFANNITGLDNAGMEIINDDVVNFHEPIYWDGPVSTAVNNYVDGGGIYFALNHNYANNCYEGVFDSGNDNDSFHAFNGTSDEVWAFQLTSSNAQRSFTLHWDEMYGSATVDLELELYASDGNGGFNLITASNDSNIGGDSYDRLVYTNNSGVTQTLHLAVREAAGNADGLNFKFIIRTGTAATPLEYAANRTGTLTPHAGTPKSIAIGAAYYATPDTPEGFSGRGPHRHLFSSGGNPIDVTYTKPDFLCYDGVDTTFFGTAADPDGTGFPNFFGTSCATPNAAAVGACAYDVAADQGVILDQESMRQLLRDTLEDLGPAGHDTTFGYGRINGLGAVAAARGPLNPDWWAYPNQFGVYTIDQDFSSDGDIERVRAAFDAAGSVVATVEENNSSDPMLIVFDESTADVLAVGYDTGADDNATAEWTTGARNAALVEFFSEVEFAGSEDFLFTIDGPSAPLTTISSFDIYADASFSGNLLSNDDADYHRFIVPGTATGLLTVTVDPDVGLDTRIQLFDSSGNLLDSSNNGASPGAVDSFVYNSAVPGEELVLAVYPDRWDSSGDFEINLNFANIPGQSDDIAALTSVEHIARPNPVTGVERVDNVSLPLAGYNTTLFLPSLPSVDTMVMQTSVSGGDLVTGGLYNSAFNRLEYDGGSTGSTSLTINHDVVSQSARYYRVFGLNYGVRGFPDLTITNFFVEQPEPADLSTVALLSPVNGIYNNGGNVSPIGDNDYYRVVTPINANGTLILSLGCGSGLNGAFDVFDTSGNLVGSSDTAGANGTDTLQIPNVGPLETFHVLVRGNLNDNVQLDDASQTGNFNFGAQINVDSINNMDSDGDGFTDPVEDAFGGDPNDPNSTPFYGDYDFSFETNLVDALRLERALPIPYDVRLDLNMDGSVNSTDADILFRWSIGLDGYEVIPLPPLF